MTKYINDITPGEWDSVSKPQHYTMGGIECIDYIESNLGFDGALDFCNGNVIKYVHRWREKNGLEDLKKAQWYLERMIKIVEKLKI